MYSCFLTLGFVVFPASDIVVTVTCFINAAKSVCSRQSPSEVVCSNSGTVSTATMEKLLGNGVDHNKVFFFFFSSLSPESIDTTWNCRSKGRKPSATIPPQQFTFQQRLFPFILPLPVQSQRSNALTTAVISHFLHFRKAFLQTET